MKTLNIFLSSGEKIANTNFEDDIRSGTWEGGANIPDGTTSYFKIYEDNNLIMEGSVTGSGMGGDMEVDNITYCATTPFIVTKSPIRG
jgi:hypothetical protein